MVDVLDGGDWIEFGSRARADAVIMKIGSSRDRWEICCM